MVWAAGIAAQVPVTPPIARSVKAKPLPADTCPLTVRIDAEGRLSDDRSRGRTLTEQKLREDVSGGCAGKGATSSVRIQPAPHTKMGRVNEVMSLVKSARPDVPITTITPRSQAH